MTRPTFGTALWHHLSGRDFQCWDENVARLYRHLHRPVIVEVSPRFSEAVLLCYQSGRPSPADQRRLLLLEHARMIGTQQLERPVDLLHEEQELTGQSWLAEAGTAFDWLAGHVGSLIMAKHGVVGIDSFMDPSLHSPGQVKGWLRQHAIEQPDRLPFRSVSQPLYSQLRLAVRPATKPSQMCMQLGRTCGPSTVRVLCSLLLPLPPGVQVALRSTGNTTGSCGISCTTSLWSTSLPVLSVGSPQV